MLFRLAVSIRGLLVIALAWKLLYGARLGLHLFAIAIAIAIAIGGGVASGRPEAARSFGIADRRTILTAYVLSACFAALAGVFLAGRISSGDPNVGPPFALDSITAVVIGGTQLSRGIGSLHGTVIGAVMMALLSNGMNLSNLSAFVQTAIKGAILLAVVALQRRNRMGL
jgi:ribose transport system permease protein